MWFRPVRPIFSKNSYFTEATEMVGQQVGQLLGCLWGRILIFKLKIDEFDSNPSLQYLSKGSQDVPK
jgi:hypothetical protein